MSRSISTHDAAKLVAYFEQAGYVRVQDQQKVALRGSASYKKGNEVRLVLPSLAAAATAAALCTAAGLRPGKPFRKHQRIVLPIYGSAAVDWFLSRLDVS